MKVRVRTFGQLGNGSKVRQIEEPTPWSSLVSVEAVLLEREDCSAKSITSFYFNVIDCLLLPIDFERTTQYRQRTETSTKSYIKSLRVYEVTVNRFCVDEPALAPGGTSYNHRLNYQIVDVTSLLHSDQDNTTRVEVGDERYAGRLGFKGERQFHGGNELAVLAQLIRAGKLATNVYIHFKFARIRACTPRERQPLLSHHP